MYNNSNRTRRYSEDDEDVSINTEVIWMFNDVDKELLKAYPNGKSLSERLVSIGGLYTWRVDLYPNGKDNRTYGNIVIAVTLEDVKGYDKKLTDAECSFSFLNKMKKQNYVGKINRKSFDLNVSNQDSSFENIILKECFPYYPLQVVISVTNYPYSSTSSLSSLGNSQLTKSMGNLSDASSATPRYSANYFTSINSNTTSTTKHVSFEDEKEDYKKETVNYLYNKYRNNYKN